MLEYYYESHPAVKTLYVIIADKMSSGFFGFDTPIRKSRAWACQVNFLQIWLNKALLVILKMY